MLRTAGWLYRKIADIRNFLYDRGVFKSYDLGAYTISIGNITAGGTGKTPLVGYVAGLLANGGERVCILTRGYGRESSRRVLVSDGESVLVDARKGGDEPVELGRKLIGKAIVVADADRVSAAAWAKEKFGITVFVLDDGFQHRRAKRDLDIVCIDATNPFGNENTFVRESLRNVSRADAIVITRSDLVSDVSAIKAKVVELAPSAPVFLARSVVYLETKRPAFAFCGLANPESFFELLRRGGHELKGTAAFRDHHSYTQTDATNIEERAAAANAEILFTTAKDAVKLEEVDFKMPCLIVEMRIEIDDETAFRDLIISS